MRTRPPEPSRRQRGVAAVEFGLTVVLLATILMAASEFGRAMYQYNTVVKGARAASRYLAQFPAGDAAAITAARNLVVYGRTTATGNPLVPGLTTAMVTVCDASNCAGTHRRQATGQGTLNLVTVSVTGLRFQSLATWVLSNITFDTIRASMPQGAGT